MMMAARRQLWLEPDAWVPPTKCVRLKPDLRLIVVFRSAKDPILSRSERRPWDVSLKPELQNACADDFLI